jgi:hypothetical protein
MTEEQAREKAQEGGWADKVAVSKTSFKANSKALAEKEGEGIAKLIYRCAAALCQSSLHRRCLHAGHCAAGVVSHKNSLAVIRHITLGCPQQV